MTQEFKQELYHPFDELAEPVEIVSSDEELEAPLDSQRIHEDIERCVSAMAMDLCLDAFLPAVPSDGDDAMPCLLGSPNKKAKADWSPHGLGGTGMNFGPGSPARQVVPKACPAQAAPPTPLVPESDVTNMLSELLKQGRQTQADVADMSKQSRQTQADLADMSAKLDSQGNSFHTAITDVRERLEVGLQLNKDEMKENMRTHMKTVESHMKTVENANEQRFLAMQKELKDYVDSCGPKVGPTKTNPANQSFAAPSEPRFKSAEPEGRFIARRLFLKGWCHFGREATEGLKEQDAVNMCTKILSLLPVGSRSLLELDRIQAPYFRNRQVTIQINEHAADNSAYTLCQEINEIIKSNNIHVNTRPVYAVGDSPQWKKTRNAALAKARSAVESELMIDGGAVVAMTMDWPAGQLWGEHQHQAALLGSWNRNKGWTWCAGTVRQIWPKADLAVLGLAVEMS